VGYNVTPNRGCVRFLIILFYNNATPARGFGIFLFIYFYNNATPAKIVINDNQSIIH
jgi:hypothetical protein